MHVITVQDYSATPRSLQHIFGATASRVSNWKCRFCFENRVPRQTKDDSWLSKRASFGKEGESQRAEEVPCGTGRGSKIGRVDADERGCVWGLGASGSSYKIADSHFARIVSRGTDCDSSIGYVAAKVGECAQSTARRLGNRPEGAKIRNVQFSNVRCVDFYAHL